MNRLINLQYFACSKIFLLLSEEGAYLVQIAIIAVDVVYVVGDAAAALAWALRCGQQ
jgi:hypothetical protein